MMEFWKSRDKVYRNLDYEKRKKKWKEKKSITWSLIFYEKQTGFLLEQNISIQVRHVPLCVWVFIYLLYLRRCVICVNGSFSFCWNVCMGLYVFIYIKFVYYILLVFLAVCRTVIGQLDFTKTSWPYLIYSHCFMYDILLSLSLTLTLSLHSRLPTLIFNLIWMVIINALDRCSS